MPVLSASAPVRLGPTAAQVADVAAAAVAFNHGQVGVAVVSSSSPEDVAAAAAFSQAAQRRGLRVRAEYTLADIESSHAQAAGAVRAAAPQVLYVAGRGLDAGALWAEIRPRDSRIRLVLGPGALDEGFFRTAAGFLDGVSAIEVSARPVDTASAAAFVSRFAARYGREPGPLAARAYDAATLGRRASASTTDGRAPAREAVRARLAAEQQFDGVMRSYTLQAGAPVSWKLALYRLMPDGTPLLIGEPEVQ
jgi:ABC-type branched-subunit amino acid transport system substrate-binding protein